MSLVKLHRENWADKKSIKRLKVIRSKCRKNYNELYKVINLCKSYNLPTETIDKLYEEWVLKAAKIDNIIFRRTEKFEGAFIEKVNSILNNKI